ncbi:MAG: hypothetical protein WD894_16005 [Pirellulales bacterium]
MLGEIGLWIVGQVAEGVTQQLITVLFSDNLLKRLSKVAEHWRGQLLEDEQLLRMEALFPKRPPTLDTPRPEPHQILQRIKKYELPTADDWSAALVSQWRWVKSTSDEPQPFFKLSEDRARARLAELGQLLALECGKDREIFQIECLRLQRQHDDELSEISQKVDSTQAAISELRADVIAVAERLPANLTPVTPVRGAHFTGRFHGQIDAAVAFTQRGQPDVALAQLDVLRKQHWDELTDRERFRVIANIGHAYNAKDQHTGAARHFIESQSYQPEDEQARCLAAVGHAILKDSGHAFQLAQGICSDFPNSDLARATWIRNAPDDWSFTKLEAATPPHVRGAVETASALAWRAMSENDLTPAELYARSALAHDPNSRALLEQLGLILLESVRREAAAQLSESPTISKPETVIEAEHLLNRVLGDTPATLPMTRGRLRFYRGILNQLQGKWEDALTDLQAAHDSDDANPQFARQFALALWEREQDDRAIVILRKTAFKDESHGNAILLAQLLAARNRAGDSDEATEVLMREVAHLVTIERSMRLDLLVSLIRLLCRTNRPEDSERLLSKLPTGVLAPEVLHILQALHLRRIGNTEEAKQAAISAFALLGGETHRSEQRRIALELGALGLLDEALSIWKRLLGPSYFDIDTPALLYCAFKCEDARFITEFCAELRKAGVIHRDAIHLEINTLQEYNCFERAADVMRAFLKSTDDSKLTREIRARLSHSSIVTGKEDFAEFDPNKLPSVNEVEPALGLAIV